MLDQYLIDHYNTSFYVSSLLINMYINIHIYIFNIIILISVYS